MFVRRMITLGLTVFAAALCQSFVVQDAFAVEVVQYRLVQPRTVHLDDEASARNYDKTLRELGCASQLGGHNGHFDLTYQCPQWRQLELADHASADKWQEWLASLGFEVGHKH
ncbi:MAG: hypothetical protein DWQ31_19730 [Planctomycetota bacterium]|nr:MAG: hypothetical protein DWQ31_19730 [Planctomycetota bacterium]